MPGMRGWKGSVFRGGIAMLEPDFLERLYRMYNKRSFVHPDPLECIYRYRAVADREIAGLVASSLAYGRVEQILKSVAAALKPLGNNPSKTLMNEDFGRLAELYRNFKHRFTTGADLLSMLKGCRRLIADYGTIGKAVQTFIGSDDITVLPALSRFSEELDCHSSFLVPSPSDGSACKRMNLFFRWMVRKDEVDPGGWSCIPRRLLVVPVDTHMAAIAREFGISSRKTADIGMAAEITAFFRRIEPDDPVKYDFVLTRFGIRKDMKRSDLHSMSK